MATPHIPDAILGVSRRLTANEIALYMIDCGPNGSLHGKQDYFYSGHPGLTAYVFCLPSCVMDNEGLYTVTIYRADSLCETDPQMQED